MNARVAGDQTCSEDVRQAVRTPLVQAAAAGRQIPARTGWSLPVFVRVRVRCCLGGRWPRSFGLNCLNCVVIVGAIAFVGLLVHAR